MSEIEDLPEHIPLLYLNLFVKLCLIIRFPNFSSVKNNSAFSPIYLGTNDK